MDDSTRRLIGGTVLLAVAALVLFSTLLVGIELPIAGYALVPVGLSAGIYLIGRSHPDRLI